MYDESKEVTPEASAISVSQITTLLRPGEVSSCSRWDCGALIEVD